jgi:hypothetical protein
MSPERDRLGTLLQGDLPRVSLEDALRFVHLHGEKESPKYERAAMCSPERYLTESSPSVSAGQAELGPKARQPEN